MIKKCKNLNSSFSLIEIIVVLFLIALISGLMVVILKPGTFFQRARDAKRVSDLSKIEEIFQAKKFSDLSFSENKFLDPKIVYISLPDSSSTCGSWLSELPSLSFPYSYRCSATPTNIDGTGWIPLDFQGITSENFLPIDPINKPPYYYSFVVGGSYEVTAKLESILKNKSHISATDGGDNPLIYEAGTNKNITPNEVQGRGATYDQLTYSDPSLVGYWPFDEGSGTIAKDYSGKGNNGTLYNFNFTATSGWTTGKVGGALSFDGVNDYVILSDSQPLKPISSISVVAWIKPASFICAGTDTHCSIFTKYGGNYIGYQFSVTADGFPYFAICTPNVCKRAFSSLAIPSGQWSFIIGTWNNNTTKVLVYIDTNLKASTNATSLSHGTIAPTIGKASWYSGNYFNGLIDEVRVYNRALSDSEIKALYQATN